MKNLVIIISFTIFLFSCEGLDVENQNEPETERVFQTEEDFKAVLDGAAFQWFNGLFKYEPAMTLLVAADVGASSWGNFGMREAGTVGAPYGLGSHSAINNTVTASYTGFLENPYNELYSAATSANDIISVLAQIEIDQETENQYNAYAYFLRGIAFGYLGLLFDKALIFDESSELESLTYEGFVPYDEVIAQAVKDLDSSVQYANAATSINIEGFNGISINKDQLIKLANGYHAKFLVQSARTLAETNAIDWNTVLTRINSANLDYDFAPVADGQTWWFAQFLSNNPGWMRVDQKVVNMVNPSSSPYPYPEGGYASDADAVSAQDARWGSSAEHKFRFAGAAPFRANRGIYFYSLWKFNDYESFRLAGARGPMNIFEATEAKLIKAEAHVRLGQDLPTAVDVINETRVGLGQKEPATVADTDLIDKIYYERILELYESVGNGFFDRRRFDDLGLNQFLHLPIPARNLDTWGAELYTTGGGQ